MTKDFLLLKDGRRTSQRDLIQMKNGEQKDCRIVKEGIVRSVEFVIFLLLLY